MVSFISDALIESESFFLLSSSRRLFSLLPPSKLRLFIIKSSIILPFRRYSPLESISFESFSLSLLSFYANRSRQKSLRAISPRVVLSVQACFSISPLFILLPLRALLPLFGLPPIFSACDLAFLAVAASWAFSLNCEAWFYLFIIFSLFCSRFSSSPKLELFDCRSASHLRLMLLVLTQGGSRQIGLRYHRSQVSIFPKLFIFRISLESPLSWSQASL